MQIVSSFHPNGSISPFAVAAALREAIGLDAEAASRTIRLSLGHFAKSEDVEFAIGCLRQVIESCSPPATVPAIEA